MKWAPDEEEGHGSDICQMHCPAEFEYRGLQAVEGEISDPDGRRHRSTGRVSNTRARFSGAVQESSHALVTAAYGFDVDRLTIATDGARGVCWFRCQGATPAQKATIFLAGYIGELLVEPATDVATARDDLTRAGEFGRGLDMGAIARRTRQLLRERWEAVIKLACALARDGELDALAVRHLIH